MKTVVTWTLFIAIIWFAALLGTTVLLAQADTQPVRVLQQALLVWGPELARFIAGPLTLAIVLYVLFNTEEGARIVERFKLPSEITFGANVQALLAIVLILAFAVSAIGGVGDTSALKDIALVVVGFYFGTRKRQDNDEIAASAAAGAAIGAKRSAETPPAENNDPAAQ
jgi:hypothetical protein